MRTFPKYCLAALSLGCAGHLRAQEALRNAEIAEACLSLNAYVVTLGGLSSAASDRKDFSAFMAAKDNEKAIFEKLWAGDGANVQDIIGDMQKGVFFFENVARKCITDDQQCDPAVINDKVIEFILANNRACLDDFLGSN